MGWPLPRAGTGAWLRRQLAVRCFGIATEMGTSPAWQSPCTVGETPDTQREQRWRDSLAASSPVGWVAGLYLRRLPILELTSRFSLHLE